MTATAIRTIEAYPLGKPTDGRARYGMTHDQARIYRWLVKNRPHDGSFRLDMREVSIALNMHLSSAHSCIIDLEARGWLHVVLKKTRTEYGFVQPIRHFAKPR